MKSLGFALQAVVFLFGLAAIGLAFAGFVLPIFEQAHRVLESGGFR